MDSSNKCIDNYQQLLRGLVYIHNRANANTAEVHQAKTTLAALVELLIEKSLLDRESLRIRRQEKSEQFRQQYVKRGMAVAMQDFNVRKYEFRGQAKINCHNRAHLCQAACCRIPLALSKEDIKEGTVRWDLGQPYILARNTDGYCTHLDQETFRCLIYRQRPIPCRGYDCREDRRIWLDFEKRLVNAEIKDPVWPQCLEFHSEFRTAKDY